MKIVNAMALACTLCTACVQTTHNPPGSFHLNRYRAQVESDKTDLETKSFDGSLNTYIALAISRNSALRARFERWRAARARISSVLGLPQPRLTYGYYVSSVETRSGPMLHKLSLHQAFPWPTVMTGKRDALRAQAAALASEFETEAARVAASVSQLYWRLWEIQARHHVQLQHDALLDSLAKSVEAKIAIGAASLADLKELSVETNRHHDHQDSHVAQRARLIKFLTAELNTFSPKSMPTTDSPRYSEVAETEKELIATLTSHPTAQKHDNHARALRAQSAHARGKALPTFRVGADYTIVGTDSTLSPALNGKDAFMLSLGIGLPLWASGSLSEARAAEHNALASDADRESFLNQARANLQAALIDVRDSLRRAELYRDTIVPEARVAYDSIVARYASGKASFRDLFNAQRTLLDVTLAEVSLAAEHQQAWITLEHIVNRSVKRKAPTKKAAAKGTQP